MKTEVYKFQEISLQNFQIVSKNPESACMSNLTIGNNIDHTLHELNRLQQYVDKEFGKQVSQIFLVETAPR